MIAVSVDHPWLVVDLGQEMRVLSWALNRPGYVSARQIVWREVRNADLHRHLDVGKWFDAELRQAGRRDAVAMITSRDIGTHVHAIEAVDGVTAECVATLGLSNAESVGARIAPDPKHWGTINIAVCVGTGLTDIALLEAMSIAAEARTAAVIEAGLELSTGLATGTGTDCIAIAALPGQTRFAGLHTPVGHAVGRVVKQAVGQAAAHWMATIGQRVSAE